MLVEAIMRSVYTDNYTGLVLSEHARIRPDASTAAALARAVEKFRQEDTIFDADKVSELTYSVVLPEDRIKLFNDKSLMLLLMPRV